MSKKIEVKHEDELLRYLVANDSGYSRSKLKSLLKNDCISINKRVTRQFNDPVDVGDTIEIKGFNVKVNLKFKIVYEDAEIIVIDKPAGILSVPFSQHDKETAYDLVTEYVMRSNPKARVHVVHRLDQGTSGVLLFAKSEKLADAYQNAWNDLAMERVYVAYTEGVVRKDQDTIVSRLNTDHSAMVYSTREGKEAITHYKVLQRFNDNTVLKVSIDTGRQNQIRVHLKELGHPIVGDKKYGARSNPLKRLGLHAYQLKLKHPETKQVHVFTAEVPKSFRIKKRV